MLKYITLLFLVIPPLLHGQNGDLLHYGSNIMGDLPSGSDIDVYRFQGSKGDRIWIRVTDANSSIDASFRLKQGLEILEQIEGTGGDVELFDFVLPDTGFYDIEIYDKNLNDAGEYGFSLHKLNNPEYARQIQCGDDVFDEIKTQVGVMVYQFSVQAGDKAFAQMRAISSHLEATMYLMNENGDLLQRSVRKANPFAFIESVEVTQDENYALFIFDANGNDVGQFGMTYQDINDPTCGTIPLACKDHYENKIAQLAETHAFQVDLEGGDGFVAKVLSLSPSLEANVTVYDPEGKSIFQKTVSGKACDIVVPQVELPGSYQIIVNDDRANDTSTYFLTYNKLDIACATELMLCHEMNEAFDVKADIDLFYFFTPEIGSDIEVKEIDRVIELYSSMIYRGTAQNAKDNVKLKIALPDIAAGNLVFLAMSDNGGNDLGAYKIRPVDAQAYEGTPPVAICKENMQFTIPVDGTLILDAKDLNNGSYDDCQIVEMLVAPNTFNCSQLGEHIVEFTVIDNEGLDSTVSATINVVTDLALNMEACVTIPVEDFEIEKCIEITGAASGGSGLYAFDWSNGTSGQVTTVCPEDAKDFFVKVTDSNGCNDQQNIWIPIGANVICHQNGKKVTICHYPPDNPNNMQELCVNTSSLQDHFGHGDLMGPCNGPCDGSSELSIRSLEEPNAGLIQLSGIVARQGEELKMSLADLNIMQGDIQIEFVNSLGQSLYRKTLLVGLDLNIQLPEAASAKGLYYLFIRQTGEEPKQVTLPIMIQ